ncbi:MAG: hypothetical protein WA823_02645 [Candidatus Acidiferrales bacterium]
MLGPMDYTVWTAGFLLEVVVVVSAVARSQVRRYLTLTLYMMCCGLVQCAHFYFLRKYGLSSKQYTYVYYYTESLLTISLFSVVIQLYQHVFEEMKVSKQIRTAAGVLVAATAFFSYAVIRQNQDHLTSRFVVELGQNLYFVGVVLTYLLWGAILKLRETRTRLIQLVLALGIYFSATAGTYALRNLFPNLEASVLHVIFPILGVWLPAAWSYTFLRVSDDARLMPAQLSVKA